MLSEAASEPPPSLLTCLPPVAPTHPTYLLAVPQPGAARVAERMAERQQELAMAIQD